MKYEDEFVEQTLSLEDANRIERPSRPLSRRALLRSAAIAPVMAAGCRLWTHPNQADMDIMMSATRSIDPAALKRIADRAVNQDHVTDRDKFELVVRMLWLNFTFGLGNVQIKSGLDILELAYNKGSGAALVKNINAGEFDPFGNDHLTNFCAYVCGHKAATKAIAGGGKMEVTKTVYEGSWDDTEREMKQKLSSARGPRPQTGFGC